jgi:hypothetical protein
MKKSIKLIVVSLLLPILVSLCGCSNKEKNVAIPYTVIPIVISTIPIDMLTDVPVNMCISIIFNEEMDINTITTDTIFIKQNDALVAGDVIYIDKVVIFYPEVYFLDNTEYTVTITTDVRDIAGNQLAVEKKWTFITGGYIDSIPPEVDSTIPDNFAVDFGINKDISVTFTEGIDNSTINSSTFILKRGEASVPGQVTLAGSVAVFNPAENLAPDTVYTATITSAVKDLANNNMVSDKMWSFTTNSVIAAGPVPVLLGTAGNFAILAKSGITNVPPSLVSGDMGVSPIAAAAIVGFTCVMDSTGTFSTSAQVVGKIYASDYTFPTPSNLGIAVANMEIAYNDAAGRPNPMFVNVGNGDINGYVATPGLYKWNTGVLLTGDMTLNGGPNDVWIFQITGNLEIGSGKKIILTGGAKPGNVFWQCSGIVVLNTNSHLEGIVLSKTAVTLFTGATVNGKLLAQTNVTLQKNTVTKSGK